MDQQVKKRQRSCIGCGATQEKGRLLRVVRDGEGRVAFDGSGRVPGRGAYLCSGACLTQARKSRKLERALRCKVTEEDYDRIQRDIEQAESAGKNEE
ncbi:RNase P modulator RnpM [uncultured Adlercreutzia sp.]|uniref:RNase P modulator RnpM n=1 Tax=uncultured Adlercreutzia sp. TaxID=875803 RepID=UPI0026F398EC|nr:YlxR family protein [uncultured Adlercreutzia sp.]